MKQFLREHSPLIVFILLWVMVAVHASLLLYAVLPISVFLMRRREMWPDILFGFLMCLILSDMDWDIPAMGVMKTAKYAYILALALIVLVDQARMRPVAKVFGIFMPFFFYAFLPILASPVPVVAVEKTLSYALIFLVVPNFVLINFRRSGWLFFRDLIWFLFLVLLSQHLLPLISPNWWFYIENRFRGYFGNPNGLALFTYLFFVLFTVVNHLRKDLFSTPAKVLIYALLVYYIITCGARTSLMSTLMFVLFIQFFRISTFLGIISFVAFIGVGELVSSNLPTIITAMGLQDYMRVETIADGSGRYIAWNYAWHVINTQGSFLFGRGFDYEAEVMFAATEYLESLGHQGGVHNTYLAFWMNTGIVGLAIFLRSFVLIFIKAGKHTSISLAIMFSVMFSILYESWLAGSLSPYTTMLLIILTIVSEDEIMGPATQGDLAEEVPGDPDPAPRPLILPAR